MGLFSPPAVPAESFVAPSHTATEPALGTDYSRRDRNSLDDGSGDQPAALPVSATLGLSSWKIFISGLCGTGPGDCGEVEGKGEHCSMAVCAGTLAMGELGPGIVGAQPVLENRRGHWHWSQPNPGSASRPTSCQALTTPCRADREMGT